MLKKDNKERNVSKNNSLPKKQFEVFFRKCKVSYYDTMVKLWYYSTSQQMNKCVLCKINSWLIDRLKFK